jgi:Zn-dependent protease
VSYVSLMGRSGSVQLARIFGIRIGAYYSWFLILFLAIFFAREQLAELTGAGETEVYVAAVVEAFLFFASVIAHEIGHALAARREGIGVVGIDLFLFGGLMHMRSEPATPGAEFRVAAAGPAMTLLVIVVATGAGVLVSGPDEFMDAVTLSGAGELELLPVMISTVALINVVVLAFNLLPAYPLDGGRIARAAVWRLTGDRHRGTRAAAAVGQGFGTLLVVLGVLLAVNGATFNGIYLAFLGWLLASQARSTALQSAVTQRLEGVTLADLMDADPVTIPADVGALSAYEDFFLRYGYEWFPVVEVGDAYAGRAYLEPVRQVADADPQQPVRGLVVADDPRAREDLTLEALLASPDLRTSDALAVLDGEGRLRGIVTAEVVARALRSRLAPSAGRA